MVLLTLTAEESPQGLRHVEWILEVMVLVMSPVVKAITRENCAVVCIFSAQHSDHL